MGTMTYVGELVITSCWCGIRLAIPDDLYRFAHSQKTTLYCPLGHSFIYGNTTEKENRKLRERLELQEKNARFWRGQTQHAERRLSATKGHLTRVKKRIGNGVCPCCNRHFKDVERHMKNQHPDYTDEG